MHNFGDLIKKERKRLGFSQEEFARECGVSKRAQINYEKSTRAPDLNYLSKAMLLGFDVSYVAAGDVIEEPIDNGVEDYLQFILDANDEFDRENQTQKKEESELKQTIDAVINGDVNWNAPVDKKVDRSQCEHFSMEAKRLNLKQKEIADFLGRSLRGVQAWYMNVPIPSDQLGKLVELGFDPYFVATGKRQPINSEVFKETVSLILPAIYIAKPDLATSALMLESAYNSALSKLDN